VRKVLGSVAERPDERPGHVGVVGFGSLDSIFL
jgi:hypothetical protein